MLYILWSLLNIALLIFFLFTCFRAIRILWEKFGLFRSAIFVIGLVSLLAYANAKRNIETETWNFASENDIDKTTISHINQELENTPLIKFVLGVNYAKSKTNQQNVPLIANSQITGFISGINWKPLSVVVSQTAENTKFAYAVAGTLEWKLFATTIYAQPKTYQGVILLK